MRRPSVAKVSPMALPSRPLPAVLRPTRRPVFAPVFVPVLVPALMLALGACSGNKPAPLPAKATGGHSAHGHAVALIERDNGGSTLSAERIEDEDTHWVDLPHFGECPYVDEDTPPYEPPDDTHVPAMGPQRTRATNMDAGGGTIHNEALLQHLDHATAVVLNCVSLSACYDDRALEPGSIDLLFEVAPSGDVRAVNVDPTPGLDHTGIRECARLAIWDTDFPAFDGADMIVSYELEID